VHLVLIIAATNALKSGCGGCAGLVGGCVLLKKILLESSVAHRGSVHDQILQDYHQS